MSLFFFKIKNMFVEFSYGRCNLLQQKFFTAKKENTIISMNKCQLIQTAIYEYIVSGK